MAKKGYFLDTCAIIEIIKGNKSYEKFMHEPLVTSVFNLYELYFLLLRDFGKEAAEKEFLRFKQNTIKISDSAIFQASEFKLENKKKNISYTDALGYSLSIEGGFKFLTCDGAFRDVDNVEFVKK